MSPGLEPWARLTAEVTACRSCSRLAAWREETALAKRPAFRSWSYWGKPLPGFGDHDAKLLVVGLAPAAHGGNRTGRMFTGDSSGSTLMASLYRAGYANQPTSEQRSDGLELRDAYITAVVRCAPPHNRPTAEEQANCRDFLTQEMTLLTSVRVILALGHIAYEGCVRVLRQRGADLGVERFVHGLCQAPGAGFPILLASYHPSRQNTQTGRLTEAMLDKVFSQARRLLQEGE